MRTSTVIGIALLSFGLNAAPVTAQAKVIRATRAWDGTRVMNDVLFVIEGDRIVRIVEGGGQAPAGAEVIDLRRYTVIPGLIDLHTHMTYFWDPAAGDAAARPAARPAGVTTVLAAGQRAADARDRRDHRARSRRRRTTSTTRCAI